MITLKSYKQTITLKGSDEPRLTISNAPAQTVKVSTSGSPGPRGLQGPPGPIGSIEGFELPDLTLLFENQLI